MTTCNPPYRLRQALVSLLCAVLLLPGLATATESVPDVETTRTSENELFEVSYESQLKPMQINSMHGWILHVESTGGEPIDNAEISIEGGMPMHDHGLPTAPAVTEALGDGDYLIEGMKFQMGGHWVVTFIIQALNQSDTVTFDLML